MKKNIPVTDVEIPVQDDDVLISRTDLKGRISYVSEDFARVSEYSVEEMLGKPHNLVRHPDVPSAVFEGMWKVIQSGGPWTGILKNRAKNGGFYWVDATIIPLLKAGKVHGYLSIRKVPAPEQITRAKKSFRKVAAARTNLHSRKQAVVDFFSLLSVRAFLLNFFLVIPVLLTGSVLLRRNFAYLEQIHKEQAGLEYITALRRIAESLPRHRGLLHAYLNGDRGLEAKLIKARKQTKENFQSARVVNARLGQSLHVDEHWKLVYERWDRLQRNTGSLEKIQQRPDFLFNEHSTLLQGIIVLMSRLQRTSGIYRDPDPATNWVLNHIGPNVISLAEYSGQLRGRLSGVAARGQIDQKEVQEIKTLQANVRAKLTEMLNGKSALERSEPIILIAREFEAARHATLRYLAAGDRLLQGGAVSPEEIYSLGTTAISRQFAANDAGRKLVLKALQERERALIRNTLLSSGLVLLLILLCSYGFRSIFRKLSRELTAISRNFSALGMGDLTLHERIDTAGRDELARVRGVLRVLSLSLWGIFTQIRDTGIVIEQMSRKTLTSADRLSNSSNEQASAVEETSSSVEELAASLDQIAENIQDHAAEIDSIQSRVTELYEFMMVTGQSMEKLMSLSREANRRAKDGQRQVQETVGAMSGIREMTGKIKDVIAIIDGISEKVELLSLNASIESARAGDAGRGFAVVAHEISKLSEQTGASLREISDLIQNTDQVVEAGDDKVASMMASFENIMGSVEQINESVETVQDALETQQGRAQSLQDKVDRVSNLSASVAVTSRQQKLVAEEINETSSRIAGETQKIAVESNELHEVVQTLNRPSSALLALLDHFRVKEEILPEDKNP